MQQTPGKVYTVYLVEDRTKANIPSFGSLLVPPTGITADRQYLRRHYLVKFLKILRFYLRK